MKVCAFEQASGLYAGGVALVVPNWRNYSEEWRPDKTHIPDIGFWFLGEAAKSPDLLGKRFPMHDLCDDPHCFDVFFRKGEPHKVKASIATQLEKMTRIMGDRPRVILDDSILPMRTWPWSTRRNAWGLDSSGTRVVDRKWITTIQEIALTFRWLQDRYIDEGISFSPRVNRCLERGGIRHLRTGEIDPYIKEWRMSSAAWPESRFETPRNAEPFDVRWFHGMAA